MASPVQAATQPGGAVKMEPCDGHYCFSCLESVRLDLKEAQAGGNDGHSAVLKCTACTAPPFHARSVGIQYRTKCGTCRKLDVQPWSPWTQAGAVGGAITVPDVGPDVDPDQKEGGQSVPVRGGKAAAGGKRAARKTVKCLPFSEALSYARSLLLKNLKEWKGTTCTARRCKSDARLVNIPPHPEQVYKHEGWQGYGHWLGTGNIQKGKQAHLPFEEALLYARSLKLNGLKEWRVWSRLGKMPSCPDKVYQHDGWQGYGHWLDTGNAAGSKCTANKTVKFLPFAEALLCARSLLLKNHKEWLVWHERGTT